MVVVPGGLVVKKRTIKMALNIILVVIICSMLGCIFGPDKDRKSRTEPPTYRDLSEKEDVIHNLLLSYQDLDIEHYRELLHEDYIWYMQEGIDPEFLSRDQDIDATNGIFNSKKFGHPDENRSIERLQLEIWDGSWSAIDSLEGQPCDDCWYTRWVYDIRLDVKSGATIHGHDYVDFYIVGIEEEGKKKYQIIRADDIEMPSH